jgi:hypothetical protein
MKQIRNKSRRPVRVSLPDGETVRLGPGNIAQISDDAAKHKDVLELIMAGSIELVNSSAPVQDNRGGASSPGQSRAHGASPMRSRRGDR